MEPVTIVIIAFVALAAFAGFLAYSHSTLAKTIDAKITTALVDLRTHLSPRAQVVEDDVTAGIKAAIDNIHTELKFLDTTISASLDELHAKMDSVRSKVGGAITDAEKSQLFLEAEEKATALRQLLIDAPHVLEDLLKVSASYKPAAAPVPAAATA